MVKILNLHFVWDYLTSKAVLSPVDQIVSLIVTLPTNIYLAALCKSF